MNYFTRKYRYILYDLQEGRCYFCKIDMHIRPSKDPSSASLDHLYPKSRGGTDVLWNLVCACRGCNQMKADRTEEEFIEYLKELFFVT